MFLFKPYRELEHTADLRLEIRSLTWWGLMRNATAGLTDILTNHPSVVARERHSLQLNCQSREELLHSCLQQIHLLFELKGFLTHHLKIDQLTPTSLTAQACGETYEPKRHPLETEIKAITYHQFEVTRTWWGWRARVIFDI